MNNHTLTVAIATANEAHDGQMAWDGMPYILHPLKVMDMVTTLEQKVVAVLHDTVEDTHLTLEHIRTAFGDTVAESVDALTRRDGESYEDFILRVKEGPLTAIMVKIADLTHNMDLDRLPYRIPTDKDFARVKKYTKARLLLSEEVHERLHVIPNPT